MVLKIILVIVILGLIFIWKSGRDKKSYHARMQVLFQEEWGMYTRDEYSDRIMENIRYYHEQKKTENSIDSITWNDLEMETIFQYMNHTRTSAGEEYLYHILHAPEFSVQELEKREVVIQGFQKDALQRTELELALYDIGKTDHISVYEFLSETKKLRPIRKFPHVFAALTLVLVMISLFFTPALSIMLLFLDMGMNAYFYYREKGKIVNDIALFEFILGTIRECDVIAGLPIEGCKPQLERLKELSARFGKFSRFHFLVSGGSTMSGNLFDSLFDYVRILFHVDLIKLGTMIQEVKRYEEELLEIYHIIGFLDSMLAIASYRDMIGEYAVPVFWERGSNGGSLSEEREKIQKMEIQGLYHPLVSDPVKNNLSTEKCMLLTGSNASGKSTFIKAVAINVLFAQTIHTVLADSYHASFFRVYSSMALRDDILSKESYFIVEIKSLKRIFAAVQKPSDIPVLCFVDEILRGTNTVERVAASSQLLQALSAERAMCFAATHDIELTYLLEENFENYHFEEQLGEGDISFDYRLRKGRADSRNAIRLLSVIGFDGELVQKAQERVEHFLKEGVWERCEM